MSIKNRIKDLRKQHNLTQSELGKIAGVSNKAVSAWEKGAAMPRVGAVERMSIYFKMTKTELLGWDDEIDPEIMMIAHEINGEPLRRKICEISGMIDEKILQAFITIMEEMIRK